MIQTRGLTFSYDDQTQFQFPDIDVTPGSNLLIIGKSGVGKTTLLHLLAGLLPPESGEVTIAQQSVQQLKSSELDRFRGRHIGIVFQKPHFVRSIDLLENLLLVQHLAGDKPNKKRAREVLDLLGLSGMERKFPHKLSQGQQQRATIAMATVNHPEVLLADEPTSSLDDDNCERVVELLRHHSETLGATLVVITHDMRLRSQFENTLQL